MGNYNTGSETGLPFAAQPPGQYDQEYMRRLIGTINLLVQSAAGSNSTTQTASTASAVSAVTATASATIASIADSFGSVVAVLSMPGVILGNPVTVGVSPVLPPGVYATGKVSASDTVKVEVYNNSGSSYSGTVSLTVAAIIKAPTTMIPATVSATVSAIADGYGSVVATLTMLGAVPGNPVTVGVSPALPAGVYAVGKVTADDTVAIEIYNNSGSPYSDTVSLTAAAITNS